jgi:hypothetical protein
LTRDPLLDTIKRSTTTTNRARRSIALANPLDFAKVHVVLAFGSRDNGLFQASVELDLRRSVSPS